jgi:UDP-3-O-[3-hydroxymyristoyl] glucosamine N-acyltransferase
MRHTVSEIAEAIGAHAVGDKGRVIVAVAEPADAGPDDLAMAMAPKYAERLTEGAARAAMLWEGADWQAFGLDAAILVARPRLAMSGVTRLMDLGQGEAANVHPTAVVDGTAKLGQGVSVGAFAVIGPRVEIGDNAILGAHVTVGADARIGTDAYIRDHVSIGARVRIGARFRAQPGARIGADGFSYVTPEPSGAEAARQSMGDQGDTKAQAWLRIHSLGAVTIGDDVEVGANSTIDNGTVRDTVIGDGTKIDNLVHVGHNCVVGKHCLLCGQTGLSGSVTVGDHAVLGGQTGVVDNIIIGARAISGGGTKILSNVPPGRVMLGYPGVKMSTHVEIYKAQRRLPRLMRDIADLRKAVFKPDATD